MVVFMNNYLKLHDESKQISMTGARTLLMLVALMIEPRNIEEIHNFLLDCGVIVKEYSEDTVRIDINTLKAIGCEITKATKRNNHKYKLLYHPFKINPSYEEIEALETAYTRIVSKATPLKLLSIHKIFQKLASIVDDPAKKDRILSISNLKTEKLEILDELVKHESKHNRILISYQPPNNKGPEEYEITIEKLGMRNDKLYVYCYNHTKGSRSFLNISNILKILGITTKNDSTKGNDTEVTFALKNTEDFIPEDKETIIKKDANETIIKGVYFNDFIAMQRMLSFGSNCTVIEPVKIKELVIQKLKEMRDLYE